MPVSDALRKAKDEISDMMRDQDPEFKELRGVGIGLKDSIVVLLKDAEHTFIEVPLTHGGFKINKVTVGDPRAL